MDLHYSPLEHREPTSLGPVFVSGRQHSGNTVISLIIGRMPGCWANEEEGVFFDHRSRLDRMADPVQRAEWIASHLKLNDEHRTIQAIAHLKSWAKQHRDANALDQYVEVMRYLTALTGNRFWQQKATGYIFQGEEILTALPEARMIYLIRNPYDVCASLKRRNRWHERIVGWSVSWNKGMAVAHRLAKQFPKRIHLVRYEDLVQHPKTHIDSLCRFIGVPFDPTYLEVPHINPAEAKFKVINGTSGLTASRVYTYEGRLNPVEIAALDMIISKKWLVQYYRRLPHQCKPTRSLSRLGALWLVIVGPFWYAWCKLRITQRTLSGPFLARMLRRLRAR